MRLPQHSIRALLATEHADLVKQIDAAYLQVQLELAAFKQPLTLLLQDEQQRQALFTLYESFDRLHRLHEKEVARALGVQLGFNAHDGD